MRTLSVVFMLHQVLSAYAADSTLVRVTRAKVEQDSFRLPGSFESCSRQNECNRFNANLSPTASKRDHCSCSCSRQKATTFGVKNGYWQCIDNKEIRQRELSDCKRIRFNNETDTDLLRVFKVGERAVFKINVSTLDFVQTVLSKFSYQACDGGWIPLNNTGLQVTLKLWTQFAKSYMLEIDETKLKPKELLQGRVIKLAIPHGSLQKKPFCLLFKVAGVMQCPLKHILETGTPLTTTAATTTTTTTTKAEVQSPFSEAVIPTSHIIATKIRNSQTIPTATKVPKTTFKVTYLWATDGGDQTLHKASAQFSVPLIAGTAGIAGIVLSVAFFVVLLRCRKGRKERHLSSTSLELKATKSEDPTDQYSVAEEKAPYQSLSPSPDGVMERGIYVSRYNVPGVLPAINDCHAFTEGREPGSPVGMPREKPSSNEYDYAESSLVVRDNLLKIDYPVSKQKASNTPEDNAPYYHVLEVREDGLQCEEPSEGGCGKPEDIAPSYQVLEGPNPLDPQGCSFKRDEEGAHVSHHEETDSFKNIFEGSTNDKQIDPSDVVRTCKCEVKGLSSLANEEYFGCKELKSDERISHEYQALHKYAYVTIRDPKDSRFK